MCPSGVDSSGSDVDTSVFVVVVVIDAFAAGIVFDASDVVIGLIIFSGVGFDDVDSVSIVKSSL